MTRGSYKNRINDVTRQKLLEENPMKLLGLEVIANALTCLEWELTRGGALAWFNERSVEPFGYGWCLWLSEQNPNAIRRAIKRKLHAKPRHGRCGFLTG